MTSIPLSAKQELAFLLTDICNCSRCYIIAAVFNWGDMSATGNIFNFGGGHSTNCCHEKSMFAIERSRCSGNLVQSKFSVRTVSFAYILSIELTRS